MMTCVIGLLILLSLTTSAFAQTPSEQAVKYFEVFKSGEYDKAASFFDPKAIKDFRKMFDFGDALPENQQTEFYTTFFGEDSTKESVAKLTDLEFFSSVLAFVLGQAMGAGGVEFQKVEILGEVPEGKKVIHVLARTNVKSGKIKMEAMEVLSFRKSKDGWKLLLSGKMKGMAAQLREAFR